MQIQFDPRDPSQLATVARIVAALQGGASIVPFEPGAADTATFTTDAAEAFGDDRADAETAFAGNATVADAPNDTPATPVAAAPASPPGSPPSGVETDAKGFPWDARIHSGPADKKPKNSDGTWRRKRNTDDALVAQVEAELRQVMSAGGNSPAPTPPPPVETTAAPVSAAPPAPVETTAAPVSAAPPAPPVPAAPAPTAAPAAPVPTPPAADTALGQAAATTVDETPAAGDMTFPQLMRQITALQSAGTLTIAGTNEIAQALGLTGVRDLVHRPDLVASFAALLPEQAAA